MPQWPVTQFSESSYVLIVAKSSQENKKSTVSIAEAQTALTLGVMISPFDYPGFVVGFSSLNRTLRHSIHPVGLCEP